VDFENKKPKVLKMLKQDAPSHGRGPRFDPLCAHHQFVSATFQNSVPPLFGQRMRDMARQLSDSAKFIHANQLRRRRESLSTPGKG
jgi:hypothetical protein